MTDLYFKIYNSLPYTLRTQAASLRGFYLKWWRYGPETEQLVQAALAREKWENEQWKNWQDKRLAHLLNYAATKVPFYRNYWLKRKRSGDNWSWEKLDNWPVLKKESIRQNPKSFVADDIALSSLFELHTSGTTGKPLKLWRSRKTNRQWYALFEARWRRWYSISKSDRWAILGGQLVTPFEQKKPPFWVWNAGLKQLYMSSQHLAFQNISAYIRAIKQYKIQYLWGYASSLYSLALGVYKKKIEPPNLKIILSNAEPLYEHQKELIGKAFKCPVKDTYGMTEIAACASECQKGMMHLWPECGLIEVFDADEDYPVKNGINGRLICTGLLNEEMPLIRYEVGDHGALSPPAQTCECGRNLPLLTRIEGRSDDVIITKDGRRIGRLDPVFKGDFPILEAQIIQESVESLRVKFVPSEEFKEHDKSTLINRLRSRVGEMKILLEPVDTIPRLSNGKFQAVVSLIGKRPSSKMQTIGS